MSEGLSTGQGHNGRKGLFDPQRKFGLAHTPLRSPARLLKSENVGSNGALADVRTPIEQIKVRERTTITEVIGKGPFYVSPTLVAGDPKVKVTQGWVLHTETGTDNNPIRSYTAVATLADIPAPTFAVTDGDEVYVKVLTTASGKPTAATIEVIASASPPTNIEFIPTVDGASGQTGELYYKLAKVGITGTTTKITQYHIGHIQVDQSRSKITNVGGEAKVFKRYNPETGAAEYRTIEGSGIITVTQNADTILIEFAGTGGWYGEIQHHHTPVSASTKIMTESFQAGILIEVTHSDGYVTGTGVSGDEGLVEFHTADTDT